MNADDPVGVLATGTGGYGAVRALRRALPHEDLVLVCDHAYAPYPRRPPAVVLDRVTQLADELAERPVKALLVASAAATDETLAVLQQR
ncbi:MAG: glutamate racemase, partial [Gaiellales bacterium]